MGDITEKPGSNGDNGTWSWSLIKFLDDNVRYIKYPFFLVGITGAIVIARSVKLGKKFTSVKSIPKEFFSKNFTLYGKVENLKIDDRTEQLILFVDHLPIFSRKIIIPRKPPKIQTDVDSDKIKAKEEYLKIVVPGLSLKPPYFQEVYGKLYKQRIAFTLLETKEDDENEAYSLVFVRVVKLKIFPKYENVGLTCVQNGQASTAPIPYPSGLRSSLKFTEFYANLLKMEDKAVKKKKGIWGQENVEKSSNQRIYKAVRNKILEYFKWFFMKVWGNKDKK